MSGPPLEGKVTDYGDLLHVEQWLVKGRKRHTIVFHLGAPRGTTPADRVIHGVAHASTGKVDVLMDLQVDKQVALSIVWKDELGNVVPGPTGATVVYTVDDPTVINLTDNGDGTGNAAAVGVLGNAVVHAEVTLLDGTVKTGDLLISVVAGDAERFEIVAGPPTEVTPDA